jgi:hypothetical protein
MIGDALRAEIEKHAVRMKTSNPLFYMAEQGTMTAACLKRYVTNVHHLIRYTPVYLVRARDRALAIGERRLAQHYEDKRAEEVGHDVWAERDLERLATQTPTPSSGEGVVPAMSDLVSYLADLIDEDPALYLSYILFAEHLIVILGAEWLRLLEERCNIPPSSLTVVGNHAELDRGHVEEALDCIDELVADPKKLPRMREVVMRTIALFERFCAEVTGTEATHGHRSLRDTAHVPAA